MLLLAGALAVAACGGDDEPKSEPTDQDPTANAGSDATANPADVVTLNGSGTDPAGAPVSYSWLIVGDAAGVTLSDARIANPTFTAPAVTEDTTLTFELEVTGNGGRTATDRVTITINAPPDADAGDAQTVAPGTTVTLDGGGSSDPGGGDIEYAWTVPAGAGVTLSDADVASPTFTAPAVTENTDLVFTLTVTDGDDAAATDTVTVTVTAPVLPVTDDEAPTLQSVAFAEGGAPTGTLGAGDAIRLAVTFSKAVRVNGTPRLKLTIGGEERSAVYERPTEDPEDGSTTLTFVYTVQTGDDLEGRVDIPENPLVFNAQEDEAIVSADDPDAPVDEAIPVGSFDVSEELAKGVTVKGGDEPTPTPTTPPSMTNASPIANAGSNDTVNGGEPVTLDGSGSRDDDGSITAYSWMQQSPTMPTVTLAGGDTAMATFTAPVVAETTVLVFRLEVTDDDGDTDTAEVRITVPGTEPTARAGNDRPVRANVEVTLDGSGSSAVQGRTINTYQWMQLKPTTPVVALADADAVTTTFTVPDVPDGTVFEFRLTVTGSDGLTGTDEVSLTVSNTALIVVAGNDREAAPGGDVVLNGMGSSAAPGRTISTYSWTQTSPSMPTISLTNENTIMATFTAPTVATDTDFVFQLEVTDSGGQTGTSTVTITVRNTPPTARVGNDRTEQPKADVILNGTRSTDTGGTIDTYLWTQQSPPSPRIELENENTATATFTAPVVTADTTFVFRLVVTDDGGDTDTAEVEITVPNTQPVAEAGDAEEVRPSIVVTLDGSGSRATGGSAIDSHRWTQLSPQTPAIALADATAASTTFTAPVVPADTTFVFQLEVTAESGLTATDTVSITVSTAALIVAANIAGNAQEAAPGSEVTLDGSGSNTAPGGVIVTYRWTQVRPATPTVELTNEDRVMATFIAPAVAMDTTFEFQLEVTDSHRQTETDTVSITVPNTSPTAMAVVVGGAQRVNSNTPVTLDGSGSTDPGGVMLEYSWELTSGAGIVLSATNVATPNFTAPAVTTDTPYTFTLTVTDDDDAENTAEVMITVNAPPVAVAMASAGVTEAVNPGVTVTLDGSDSTDTGGGIGGYSWALPDNVDFTLSDTEVAEPTFTTPSVTADTPYIFTLTVTDSDMATATAPVTITVNAPPTANAGSNETVNPEDPVTLDGSGSMDPGGGGLDYSWEAPSGITLSDAEIANPTFTAPAATTADVDLIFTLTVTDELMATASAQVTITINAPPTAEAGPVQTVNPGATVTLAGSGSDPGADDPDYSWEAPSGITLSNAEVRNPTFTAPAATTADVPLVFTLTVTDAHGATATDEVTITVNAPPMAEAGPNQNNVAPGTTVTLNGSGSDPSGSFDYSWSPPSGSGITLSSTTVAGPTFSAPEVTADTPYLFTLTVTDAHGATATDDVTITVIARPSVNPGPNQDNVAAGSTVALAGSGTARGGRTPLTFAWRKVSGPTVVLSNPNIANPTFTAPNQLGSVTFVFELTVTDSRGLTNAGRVTITVTGGSSVGISGHGGSVRGVAMSSNGRRAVSGGHDGIIRLWDIDAAEEIKFGNPERSLGDDGSTGYDVSPIHSVAISRDGLRAVSTHFDGHARLWNTQTGAQVQYGSDDVSLYHPGTSRNMIGVFGAAVPSDYNAVLAGFDGTLRKMNDDDGSEIQVSNAHLYGTDDGTGRAIYGVSLNMDGNALLMGDADGNVRRFNMTSRAVTWTGHHAGAVHGVSLSSDGSLGVSGGADNTVRFWNVSATSNNEYTTRRGSHASDVSGVALSGNGGRAFSVGEDGTMRMWNASNGNLENVLHEHDGYVYAVATNDTGTRAITGGFDDTVRIWHLDSATTNTRTVDPDAAAGNIVVSLAPDIVNEPSSDTSNAVLVSVALTGPARSSSTSVTISVAGGGAGDSATAGSDFNAVSDFTINIASGMTSASRTMNLTVKSDSTAEDHETITVTATANIGGTKTSTADITINGTKYPSDVHAKELTQSDGSAAHDEGASGRGPFRGAALSDDGSRALSGGKDDKVRFWNTQTGEVIWTRSEHTTDVQGVALSADGRRGVSVSMGGSGRGYVWNTDQDAAPTATLGRMSRIDRVSISADGSVVAIATNDRQLRIYNPETGGSFRDDGENISGNIISISIADVTSDVTESGSVVGTHRNLVVTSDSSAIRRIRFRLNNDGSTSTSQPLTMDDQLDNRIEAVSISGNGEVFAAANQASDLLVVRDNSVLWKHASAHGSNWIQATSITYRGRLVATGSHEDNVKLWRGIGSNNNPPSLRTMPHANNVRAVAMTRDGRFVLSYDEDGKLFFYALGRKPHFSPSPP